MSICIICLGGLLVLWLLYSLIRKNKESYKANGKLQDVWDEATAQEFDLHNVKLPSRMPLVTAMCVTRKRVPLLRRAVRDFSKQTHAAKELLIVYDEDDEETADFHRKNQLPNVRFYVVKGKHTLGELRNKAVDNARGEYVIQWDDDDEYHPDRIYFQLRHSISVGHKASTLERWMIKDDVSGKNYVSHARKRQGTEAGWEGTILAPKKLMKEVPYPGLKRGEDSVVTQELCRRNQIFCMTMPQLYTYHLHGRNTYEREHGLRICSQATEL